MDKPKMKFTVELDDFYMDEDDYLEDKLKSYIAHDVVQKIQASIKDKIDKEITAKVEEFINARMSVIINDQLQKCIDTGTITQGREEVSIVDHVKKRFMDNSGWSSPNKHIDEIAKEFGKDLKNQYNTVFANRIVQNIKEQGLLKDEVVQILLGNG